MEFPENWLNEVQTQLTHSFTMWLVLSVWCLLFACIVGHVSCDASSMIPLSKDSYAYSIGDTKSSVTVDFYIDLTCSSCLENWPTITEVVQTYEDKVYFNFRVFPLPYHQQAFLVAKGASLVNYFTKGKGVFTYMNTAFANQALIYNTATADLTYNQVVDIVESWATTDTGVSSEEFTIGMNSSNTIGSNIEMYTRYMWKYTCLDSVFATPFYAINGLQVGNLNTFADWQQTLDSLLI